MGIILTFIVTAILLKFLVSVGRWIESDQNSHETPGPTKEYNKAERQDGQMTQHWNQEAISNRSYQNRQVQRKKEVFDIYVESSSSGYRRENRGQTLYGQPLVTQDDWDRWWVLKGLSEGYLRRIYEIERALSDCSHPDPQLLLSEWHIRYDAYKTLCSQHGMWNDLLRDRSPYVPTAEQLRLEKILYQDIENQYQDCLKELELYNLYRDQIFAYLLTQLQHKSEKKKLFKHFKQDDKEKNKQFRKAYNQLVRNKVLTDRQNKDGISYVRKTPNRKPKEISLSPSTFSYSQYSSVDKKLLYKVEYTVGAPMSVDRSANTCTFTSKTSGEVYHTSLSECTCPVFSKKTGHPCKHMLALALHLGYISRSDSIFK